MTNVVEGRAGAGAPQNPATEDDQNATRPNAAPAVKHGHRKPRSHGRMRFRRDASDDETSPSDAPASSAQAPAGGQNGASRADGPAFPEPTGEWPGPAYPQPGGTQAGQRFPRAHPEPAFGAPPAPAFPRPADELPGATYPPPADDLAARGFPPAGAQAGPWLPRPAGDQPEPAFPQVDHAQASPWFPGPAQAEPEPASGEPTVSFAPSAGEQPGPALPRPAGDFPGPAFPRPDAQASPWLPRPPDAEPGSASYFDVFARVAPPAPQTSRTFTAPAAPAPPDDAAPEAGAPAPAAPRAEEPAQAVVSPAPAHATPVATPPVATPPVATPPVEATPAAASPAETTWADAPVAEMPPAEASPADTTQADTTQADLPRADLPRADLPRADLPRADLPRAEAPPAETTQADLPRAETSRPKAPPAPAGASPAPVNSFPRPRLTPRFTPAPPPTLAFPKPVAVDAPPAVTAWRAPAAEEDEPSGPVLPAPPDDAEKVSYIRRHSWILTVGSLISFPVLLFSQWQLMMLHHWFWFYVPFVAMGLIFLVFPMLTDGLSHGFNMRRHRQLVESWRPEKYPSVDVFLPVCGEPIEVLHNTWHYVARMSQHYKGTVTAYVLDDSASPDLKSMARDFGFAYATRPNRGWFKKSGNLLWGYEVSTGDYILLLDADFAPRHDLLDETLPYLEAYPDTGIVQTPQFFRVTDSQTWVERGAGAVQELFYRSIQTARADKGGAICVGSCAVYRRAALKDNEGMTLAEHSEDVRTGFDLHRLGWKLRYLPIALSTGNCPDNVLAFLNQQYRWCSGTVGLLFGPTFWRAKLKLYTRMCYLSGFVYYIYTAVFTFVVPALTIAILLFVPSVLQFRNMIFMVPVLLYSGVIYPLWHHAPYRLEAWAVKLISGWAHVFAYWDAIRGKRLGWKPSGGDKKKQDGRRRFWVCFLVWSCGSSLAWAGLAFWRMVTLNPANFVVLFILGVFECMIAARVVIQPAADTQA